MNKLNPTSTPEFTNRILLTTIAKGTIFKSKDFYVAPRNMDCQKMVVTKDTIYVGCISQQEKNFQICSFNWIENRMSQCSVFQLDWGIQDFSNLEIEFNGIKNKDSTMTFIVLLKPRSVGSMNINRFFILTEDGNYEIQIPLENVNILAIDIISHNKAKNIIHFMMGIQNGKLMDMVSFMIQNFILDHDSVENGLIKEGILRYKLENNKIVIYQLEKINHLLRIEQMNILTMEKIEYTLENQIEVLYMDSVENFMFIVTRNTKFITQSYIIDLKKNRIFMWDKTLNPTKQFFMILIHFNNRNYLWEFFIDDEDSSFKFILTQINHFNHVTINYNSEHANALRESNEESKWFTVDPEGQPITKGVVSFYDKKILIHEMHIQVVKEDYLFNKFHQPMNQARVYGATSIYMMIYGNNLPTNIYDANLLYFNEISLDLTQYNDVLKGDTIIASFMFRGMNFITKSGRYVGFEYMIRISPKPITIEVREFANTKLFKDLPKFDPAKIETAILHDFFLLVLYDNRRLFVKFVDSLIVGEYLFQEIVLPQGKICHRNSKLLYCYIDPNNKEVAIDSTDGKAYYTYYNIIPLGQTVILEELFTFIPDFSEIINDYAFYYSMYDDGAFTLVQQGINGYEILHTLSTGVEDVVSINFIKKSNQEKVKFFQLMKGYQLFIIHKDTIEVWVTWGHQTMKFPAENYLENYKELVKVKILRDVNMFIVIYRSNDNKLYGLFYLVDSKPFNRLIKHFQIDKKDCSKNYIQINYFERKNYIYISYTCYENLRFKLWKYMGELEMNLQMLRGQDSYRVQIGPKIESNVFLKEMKYYRSFSINTKEVVLPEEETYFQIYDLEEHKSLILKGDIISLYMEQENPNAKLLPRVNRISYHNLDHEVDISPLTPLELSKSVDSYPMLVTNEFFMIGQDTQNNNFYSDCIKLEVSIDNPEDNLFRNTYLCFEKGSMAVYITDFFEIKIGLEINKKVFRKPYLIKVSNYLYLIAKQKGINSLTINKYNYNGYSRDYLNPIFILNIPVAEFSSSLHAMDYYYATYHKGKDLIIIVIKEWHATTFSIRGLNIEDNFMDYHGLQWITFIDRIKKKIYFNSCSNENDEIICLARSEKDFYIFKLIFNIKWKLEITYKMATHYSIPSISKIPLAWKKDDYFAALVQINNIPERIKELDNSRRWPLIQIFKLNPITKKGEIFYILFKEDILRPDMGDKVFMTDLLFSESDDGKVILSVLIRCNKATDNDESIKRIQIMNFEIDNYRLEYNTSSYQFRDSITLVGLDYNSNKQIVVLPILIKKNQRLFMYFTINVSLAVIFFILCVVCFIVYVVSKKDKESERSVESPALSGVEEDVDADSIHFEGNDHSNSLISQEDLSKSEIAEDKIVNE